MIDFIITIKEHYIGAAFWWQISALMIIIFFIIENKFAAKENQSTAGRIRNVAYSLIYLLVGTVLASFILIYITNVGGLEEQNKSWFESLFSIALVLFLTDFCYYWYHRAQHAFHFLWVIHELHHADEEMNATTSWRTHFIEQPVQLILVSLPGLFWLPILIEDLTGSTLCRLTAEELIIYTYIATFFLIESHANIRFSMGRLTVLATGPQYHRIHHSIQVKHRDKNFAQYFPLLDKVFGTYYFPLLDEFPDTGVKGLPSETNLITTTLRPFKQWKLMLKK